MAIKLLPPQLANQIAAGEVVERPASVVKELVENSLDAGATQIIIDIEKGGASLIRIRDNGIGIPKQELSLSLARHATSKISSIEDLEQILTLGFRGEALASISSVSHLTLTSRPSSQPEAWQVYAQGQQMETTIKPASHPVGTTLEVANLFFNTPARRKFLRTEKTEFAHIDEVVRRIALAKSSVSFQLSHNGKILRQYRAATNDHQQLKRLASLCGDAFVQQSFQLDWQYEGLHLFGYLSLNTNKSQEIHYSYINGRMVRDKVLTHAIRQAYSEVLGLETLPNFVLFLDLDPNDVDVNVHPTKHEVRFHQSRFIHDFIYQGVVDTLKQACSENRKNNSLVEVEEPISQYHTANRSAAGENVFLPPREKTSLKTTNEKSYFSSSFSRSKPPSQKEQRYYQSLVQPSVTEQNDQFIDNFNINENKSEAQSISFKNIQISPQHNQKLLKALALIDNFLLFQQENRCFLMSVLRLQRLQLSLTLQDPKPSKESLLIPLRLTLTQEHQCHLKKQMPLWQQLGFECQQLQVNTLLFHRVPTALRQQNLQQLFLTLLSQEIDNLDELIEIICQNIRFEKPHQLTDGLILLTETERLLGENTQPLNALLMPLDLTKYLDKL